MSKMRIEHDLLGDREVPAEAYYGVHTLRAKENFQISGTTIAAFAALPVAIFAVTFRRDFVWALSAGNRWTGMMERMMLASLAGIALIVLFTGSTTVRERWLDPFLLVLPLYFLAKMQAAPANPN